MPEERMSTDHGDGLDDRGDSSDNNKNEKMFTLKKWNAVAMWSWDVECDTCAICRVQVMDSNTVMMKIKSLRTYISNRKMKRLKSGLMNLEDGPELDEHGHGEGNGDAGHEDVKIKQEMLDEFGDLQFLAPYVMGKNSLPGVDNSMDQESFDDTILKIKAVPVYKRKKMESPLQLPPVPPPIPQLDEDPDDRQGSLPGHVMFDNDSDYHFFMSLYGDFKKIQSSQLRGRLKLDLQRIIYEALFQGILPGQIEF